MLIRTKKMGTDSFHHLKARSVVWSMFGKGDIGGNGIDEARREI